MHLKLPPDYVDPATGTPLPDAVLVIADCEFRMRAGDTRILAAVYANAAAVGVKRPVWEAPLPALSHEETAAQQPALLEALYAVILSRPAYQGATFVP